MAGSLADYAENKILDHITGKTAFVQPTAYVALYTVMTGTDAGTFTEVADSGSYARLATTGTDWDAASSGAVANAAALTFTTATGDWGTVVGFSLMDSGTHGAGNMLCYGTCASKTVSSGDTASFAIGALDITLD